MTHQWGSLSEGIPKASDAIIPRQVPIWQRDPSEPLYFVGDTCITAHHESTLILQKIEKAS